MLQRLQNPYFLGLIAYAFFCFHDALSRLLISQTSLATAIFFIQSGIVVWVMLSCLITNRFSQLKPVNWRWQVMITMLNILTMLGFYLALPLLPIVEIFIIVLSRPLFSTLLAFVWLKEKPTARQWLAICVGFLAILCTFFPHAGAAVFNPTGILLALLNPLASGIRNVLIRQMGSRENPFSITLNSALGLSATSLILLGMPDTLPEFHTTGWLMLVASGFFAAASWLYIRALHYGSVVILSITHYSVLLWAALFGYLFFAETPSLATLAGGGLILLSGMVLFIPKPKSQESPPSGQKGDR